MPGLVNAGDNRDPSFMLGFHGQENGFGMIGDSIEIDEPRTDGIELMVDRATLRSVVWPWSGLDLGGRLFSHSPLKYHRKCAQRKINILAKILRIGIISTLRKHSGTPTMVLKSFVAGAAFPSALLFMTPQVFGQQRIPCDAFMRNPNGTWLTTRQVTVNEVTMGAGALLRRGVSFNGYDLAALLEERCRCRESCAIDRLSHSNR
jgi:hypothetical protein